MNEIVFTKDWSYNRDSHLQYLNDTCVMGPYSIVEMNNVLLATNLIPSLQKQYRNDYNKELLAKICTDNTIDDPLFPGKNYWSDIAFYVEEEEEIQNVLNALAEIGTKVTEDSVYYNPQLCIFFITLYRLRDDDGPDVRNQIIC